jgi:hypothetical protein
MTGVAGRVEGFGEAGTGGPRSGEASPALNQMAAVLGRLHQLYLVLLHAQCKDAACQRPN